MYTYRNRTWVLVLGLVITLVAITAVTIGASPAYPGKGNGNSMGYFLVRRDARLQSIAGVPTVDGLYTGDETNYYVLGQADSGRGTLYFNLVGNTLYLLMRVNSSVNDNVFAMDPKNSSEDQAYLASVGWSKHHFKDLWKSDHIEFTLTCGSNSWTWRQDYLYDQDNDGDPAEKDWRSDPFNPYDSKGKESGGTTPPGLVSSSSLAWNLNNSPWDITLGGTRSTDKDYKSPYDDPNVVPASYDGFDTTHQWEWAMVYETSMDVSACGGQDIYVGVTDAHNSPSKDGTRVVPVTPTVVHTPTPTSTPTSTPTPTPTPTSTPTPTPTSTPTPPSAHIGDYVWNDINGNGLQDEGSGYGINGVTVKLYLDDGDNVFEVDEDTLIATQATTGDGGYDFTVSASGTYWVYVDETSPALGGLTHISGAESQDNPHMVVVNYGDDYNLADFGYAGRGNISGTVFYDWDEDGQQDTGEDGIGNVEVCLYRDNGDRIFNGDDVFEECTYTNADGTYTFSNYLPGTYLVVETQPGGLQSTIPSNNVRVVDLVVVGASGSAANNDFGEIVKGRIGDFTYNDTNGNGVQDSGETTPVQNVSLHITGLDIIGQTIDQVVNTGTSGTYELANLLPGTYTVTAPSVVGSYVLTSPSVQTTTLSVGNMENLNLDFGYIYPTAVSVISVTIQPYVTGVHMEWAVNLNEGAPSTFMVWRAVSGGRWKQLTPSPLEPLIVSGPYAYYGYEDTDVYPGTTYMYRLEDTTGQMFGPWEVTVPEVDDGGSTLSSRRAFLPLIER